MVIDLHPEEMQNMPVTKIYQQNLKLYSCDTKAPKSLFETINIDILVIPVENFSTVDENSHKRITLWINPGNLSILHFCYIPNI